MNNINFTNTIVSNDICLRKLELNDLRELYKNCSSDCDVAKYCSWKKCNNIIETKYILKKWILEYNVNYSYIWGIEILASHQLIGTISVVEKDFKKKICEVGYAIGKKWWNKGYMTKCLSFVMNFLLNYTEFSTIICKAQTKNVASINVMQKNGMIFDHFDENYYNEITFEKDNIATYIIDRQKFNNFNNIKNKYNNYEFTKFITFYNNLVKKYKKSIDNINTKLLKILLENKPVNENNIYIYKMLLNQKKHKLFDIINECVEFFDLIKKNNVIIYINGSYSRESQRLYSDIDINYIYNNKLIPKMLIVEDLIAYILTNIFDIKYRDRIHPMGYLALINNFKITNSNKFVTIFNTGDMIINECRSNCFDIMYEDFNIPRSLKSVVSYISDKDIINEINEFVYNHEIIYSNYNNDFIMDTILKKDKEIIFNKSFFYYFNLFVEKLNNDILYQRKEIINNLKYVNDFKKIYKSTPLEILYNLFMLIRRLKMHLFNNVNVELIKIDFSIFIDFVNNEDLINNLNNDYYEYIFELNRIEHIFRCSGMTLSSHSNYSFDIIVENYQKMFNKNLFKEISNKLECFYLDLNKILLQLKKDYKDE